ncbi:specifically androgen-regulated gene protein isoform X1 [Oryzias latipes]|uniref:Specifically androgen-regulated gene protein n=2 Tax=Oryzias latipes TaxID=8090 RepID=A0A3B3HV78_ORYLA|nr:specifically androgen-regulated gene protein isoform X1 [Oryzias latipes]XP_020559258.1 specifically androgen-regulated gene protein isoform X1 [Oryzias latipes]
MPKSDTWPGEWGPDTMRASDSAGSYSVLSGNSGLSSLEHLSAEEKACLMFLEETIESLDTEDDGRLSSEEPDPHPGNPAKKLPDPSGAQKLVSEDKMGVGRKPTKNIMVPTPFMVAGGGGGPGSEDAEPTGKPACLSRSESDRGKCSVVQWEETAAPSKPGDGSSRTADVGRGPLSYDALVHLRRNASTKKTPLCPEVDHTIDSERRCPSLAEGPVLRKQQRSDKSHPGPPAVAPKPKKIPAHISLKTQTEESSSVQNAADPQMVRLEALQKLGLLKDQGQEGGAGGVLPAPKHQPTPDPAFRGSSGDSSVCSSQLPKGPKTEALQPEKAAAVEDFTNKHNHNAHRPKPRHKAAGAAPRAAPKPPDSVGYTVMVVPGMGAERQEALRKLGLLKN